MTNKTPSLRTELITPNMNISFPIGTILAVQKYYKQLELSSIFGKHKNRGRDINRLIQALVSYKLSETRALQKHLTGPTAKNSLRHSTLKPLSKEPSTGLLKLSARTVKRS